MHGNATLDCFSLRLPLYLGHSGFAKTTMIFAILCSFVFLVCEGLGHRSSETRSEF